MAKIENPLTKLNKKNKYLKIILIVTIVLIPTLYYVQSVVFESYYQHKIVENKKLKEAEALKTQKMLEMQKELKEKEAKLKKLTLTKNIIKNFIQDKNPDLSSYVAENYAAKIMRESAKRGHSPYIQASLLASESDFKSNPRHAIRTVYGMGGIYADVWADDLKDVGIITCNKDLLNPMKNIESSAFVVSTFMKSSKSTYVALAKYKGYSPLGKSQAQAVIRVAVALKSKERKYYS